MSGGVNVKLPATIVTLETGRITGTQQSNDLALGIRVTRAGNVRVTRGGNIRATHYAILSYPEVVTIKLPGSVVTLAVEESIPMGRKATIP